MISSKPTNQEPMLEPTGGRPVASGEQWLGRNADRARTENRLWERLNPRHRKMLLLVARALALRQSQARLPEAVQIKLAAIVDELARLATQIENLLATMATRTPPAR